MTSRPTLARLRAAALAIALPVVLAAGTSVPTDAHGAERATAAEGRSGDERTAKPQQKRRRQAKRAPVRTRRKPRQATARALPPLQYTTPATAAALAADIGTFLDARTRSGTWGAMVVSVTRGDTIFARQPDAPVVPASTMKMFTTALALEHLGPAYRFSTDVLRDGRIGADGTLDGNIILRGGGDPAFSSRFIRGGYEAPMTALARMVAAAGVKRVRGDVIGDATAFEDQRVPDGWLPRYLESGYAARVSALSVNENLATVGIEPKNGRALVTLQPASSTLAVTNSVRVVRGNATRISVVRRGEGAIEVRGTVGAAAPARHYLFVVENPALYVAGAFRAALEAAGVAVEGAVRLAPTPTSAARVGGIPSPTLRELAAVTNRESINHFAELIFRNVAHHAGEARVGSAVEGNQLLKRFLVEKVGTAPTAVHAADGSGLSTLDRVTARSLVELLAYAHRAPWAADFHASLPVAGESELLRHRMRFTPAHGNLHAKTGTTNEVIGLSGYVTARSGEILAFAFIYNGTDRWNAREAIDAAGATLAAFGRN